MISFAFIFGLKTLLLGRDSFKNMMCELCVRIIVSRVQIHFNLRLWLMVIQSGYLLVPEPLLLRSLYKWPVSIKLQVVGYHLIQSAIEFKVTFKIFTKCPWAHLFRSSFPPFLVPGVLAYFAVVIVYLGGFRAAKVIHNDLLRVIIRGSVCRFFDVTPIGRLLNSFSGDMDVIDEELPATLDSFMTFIWMVFAYLNSPLYFSATIYFQILILFQLFW